MRIELRNGKPNQRGSIIIPYFVLLLITASAVAGLGAYVAQTTSIAHRRNDMIAAIQYAQGGAVIACRDLNSAATNKTGTFSVNIQNNASGHYALNSGLSTSTQKVYERTINAPFTGQEVTAQIWVTNTSAPSVARIVA